MDPHKRAMRHSSKDPNWRTPTTMVAALRRTFPFQVDLAADVHSRVATSYLGPDHTEVDSRDGLRVAWHQTGHTCGFLNPPYSISKITALREARAEELALVPKEAALYDQRWTEVERQIYALRIDHWAQKAYEESLHGFTTIGVFPYAPQTKWFRRYVMGHVQGEIENGRYPITWNGHAALDYWRVAHRVHFLRPDGSPAGGANVNTCVIIWGPNPGFVGPWVPSGRYWSYR